MDLEVERDIEAPAEVAWAVVTDIDASATTLTSVTAIERLDDHDSFDVGTRWRETRVMFGRETTEEMEVVAIDPGRSYTVQSARGNTIYTSVLSVTPTGEDSCRLTMAFGAQVSGLGSRLLANTLGRVFLGATRRALERDLVDIATAAEQRNLPSE